MNSRREPYIGMPIVLGEYESALCANPADRPQRPKPPQGSKPPQMPPQNPMPPQTPPQRPPQMPKPPQGSRPPQMQNPSMPQEPSRPQNPSMPQEPGIESNPQPPQTSNHQSMVVGMAYVPWQKWQQPYDYEKGFQAGTIFPDLNLPFSGYRGGMGK